MMTLKPTYETKVYICESNYIAIRQSDHMGNDDPIVILSPEQAEQVCMELQRLVELRHDWWSIEDEDSEKEEPSTPPNVPRPQAPPPASAPTAAKAKTPPETLPLLTNT